MKYDIQKGISGSIGKSMICILLLNINNMTELERLTEILNKANGIKQNHKEMSFDSIPKFSFKISDKNDFDENILNFTL
ncbi:MAG: hypothetical protein IPH46_17735 [Bacteroidetes bacterium]|nr:hypothetical protein [Bacteroidota bacterium]